MLSRRTCMRKGNLLLLLAGSTALLMMVAGWIHVSNTPSLHLASQFSEVPTANNTSSPVHRILEESQVECNMMPDGSEMCQYTNMCILMDEADDHENQRMDVHEPELHVYLAIADEYFLDKDNYVPTSFVKPFNAPLPDVLQAVYNKHAQEKSPEEDLADRYGINVPQNPGPAGAPGDASQESEEMDTTLQEARIRLARWKRLQHSGIHTKTLLRPRMHPIFHDIHGAASILEHQDLAEIPDDIDKAAQIIRLLPTHSAQTIVHGVPAIKMLPKEWGGLFDGRVVWLDDIWVGTHWQLRLDVNALHETLVAPLFSALFANRSMNVRLPAINNILLWTGDKRLRGVLSDMRHEDWAHQWLMGMLHGILKADAAVEHEGDGFHNNKHIPDEEGGPSAQHRVLQAARSHLRKQEHHHSHRHGANALKVTAYSNAIGWLYEAALACCVLNNALLARDLCYTTLHACLHQEATCTCHILRGTPMPLDYFVLDPVDAHAFAFSNPNDASTLPSLQLLLEVTYDMMRQHAALRPLHIDAWDGKRPRKFSPDLLEAISRSFAVTKGQKHSRTLICGKRAVMLGGKPTLVGGPAEYAFQRSIVERTFSIPPSPPEPAQRIFVLDSGYVREDDITSPGAHPRGSYFWNRRDMEDVLRRHQLPYTIASAQTIQKSSVDQQLHALQSAGVIVVNNADMELLTLYAPARCVIVRIVPFGIVDARMDKAHNAAGRLVLTIYSHLKAPNMDYASTAAYLSTMKYRDVQRLRAQDCEPLTALDRMQNTDCVTEYRRGGTMVPIPEFEMAVLTAVSIVGLQPKFADTQLGKLEGATDVTNTRDMSVVVTTDAGYQQNKWHICGAR